MRTRWLVLVLIGWLAASPAVAATYTVTAVTDGADANTGDGLCADAGGACTLRAAIQQANATAGTDTVAFAIPGTPVIAPAAALPPVVGTTIIDGTTQPGGTVTLDGSGAGAATIGLVLRGPNSTVRGLAIGRYSSHGLFVFAASGSTIADCFLGTAPDGVGVESNGRTGIAIGASNVTVSGCTIGYNGEDGLSVGPGGTGNRITGTRFVSNGVLGIDLGDDGIVNPNDLLDADTGGNDLQNAPYLIKALGGAQIEVSGGLNSLPNTTYALEFFRSPSCSPSESGEGATVIGSGSVTTDSDGGTTFSIVVPVAGTTPDFITVTATAPNGSTSEFSDCAKMRRANAMVAHWCD